jgi:uncharacterized protein YdiU (UPF0061 family)
MKRFAPAYQHGLRNSMFKRLHLAEGAFDDDLAFLQTVFDWLTQSQAGWDQFFHDWFGGEASAARATESPQAALYAPPEFAPVRDGLSARTRSDAAARLSHTYFARATPHTMVIDEVEALWAPIAERDDWSLFDAKLAQLREMRAALQLSAAASV